MKNMIAFLCSRMPAIFIGMGGALTAATMAAADEPDICSALQAAIVQSENNFSDWAQGGQGAAAEYPDLGADDCGLSQNSAGQRQFHCQWKFEYRSPGASETLNSLSGAAQSCFEHQAIAFRDQGVNHPDTYDQRQFILGDAVLTISLKDKAALQKTYVFLRAQADPKRSVTPE